MDGGAAVYGYDGEGRRMKKTVGSEATYYFYGVGGLLCEFTTANTGATQAAATDRTTYRTSDKLGSAVLIMNSAGTVTENNRTLPYGEAWIPENTPSTNDKKFTDYLRDSESGLDYALNRFSQSTTGRLTSVDKGRIIPYLPTSLNRYIYTMNDPVNRIDPDGNQGIPIIYEGGELTPAPIPGAGVGSAGGDRKTRDLVDLMLDVDGGTTDMDLQGVAYGVPVIYNSRVAGADIYARLTGLWDRLTTGTRSSVSCNSFLNAGGSAASALIDSLVRFQRVGIGEIRDQPNSASPGIGAALDPSATFAFVVNTEGGYFARRGGVAAPGGYIDLTEAQNYILLHEIAHLLGVIERDTGLGSSALDDAAQRRNDQAIRANCGDLIRGRP